MGSPNDIAQVLDGDARVAFGRRQPCMAEQDLDVPDVGPAFQQVRRYAVAEGVTTDRLLQAGGLGVALETVVEDAEPEAAAALAQEEPGRRFSLPQQMAAPAIEVLLHR